jgi:hypothetical protein
MADVRNGMLHHFIPLCPTLYKTGTNLPDSFPDPFLVALGLPREYVDNRSSMTEMEESAWLRETKRAERSAETSNASRARMMRLVA